MRTGPMLSLVALALSACAGLRGPAERPVSSPERGFGGDAWVPYALPHGVPNPASQMTGWAFGSVARGRIELVVIADRLPANRTFLAQLHRRACNEGPVTEPPSVHPVSLRLVTDATGFAASYAIQEHSAEGEARALVIALADSATGIAGAPIACLELRPSDPGDLRLGRRI